MGICAKMGLAVVSRIPPSVRFNVNDEYLCARMCMGVKKKSENYISISGVMLGISGPWGHLTSLFIIFAGRLEGLLLLSSPPPHPRLLGLFVTFLLSGSFSSTRLLLFLLLWGEHLVMLMKAASFVIPPQPGNDRSAAGQGNMGDNSPLN